MPIFDALASVTDYRSAVDKSDPGQDADVESDLLAISRWLERKLKRFFTRDALAVTRVYNPSCYSRRLDVDDMSVAPTSVTIDTDGDGSFADETALLTTAYELWPLNANKGPEPEPYTAICISTYNTTLSAFIPGQRVQVSTRWGWPAVPTAINRATIELTAIWRLESPRSTSRVSEMGEVLSTSSVAQKMVDQLIREYKKTGSLIV